MTRPQRAVILAAGPGRRFGPQTEILPKALLPFGDTTLIERQLDQLGVAGVRLVTVVHGWRGHELVARLGRTRGPMTIRHERNGQYATTGTAWSLLAAADQLRQDEPVLVTHGDLVFDELVLERVLEAGGTNVAVDSGWRAATGDEVVASVAQGRLSGMRRGVEQPQGATARFVGLSLFDAAFARGFVDHCDAQGPAVRHTDYEIPRLGDYAREVAPCAVTDVCGVGWFNVNLRSDLEAAERHFLRAVARD